MNDPNFTPLDIEDITFSYVPAGKRAGAVAGAIGAGLAVLILVGMVFGNAGPNDEMIAALAVALIAAGATVVTGWFIGGWIEKMCLNRSPAYYLLALLSAGVMLWVGVLVGTIVAYMFFAPTDLDDFFAVLGIAELIFTMFGGIPAALIGLLYGAWIHTRVRKWRKTLPEHQQETAPNLPQQGIDAYKHIVTRLNPEDK